jgi:hypothetical protein
MLGERMQPYLPARTYGSSREKNGDIGMKRTALQILTEVERHGELSLDEAIGKGHKRGGDHRNQYPLALLLEEHYLGMTIDYTPPDGFGRMREFALAITLHMYLLPADTNGAANYLGIRTTGSLDPTKERVFLTAKGALYLDEYRQKRKDRLWSVVLGFATGLLVAVCAAWTKHRFGW